MLKTHIILYLLTGFFSLSGICQNFDQLNIAKQELEERGEVYISFTKQSSLPYKNLFKILSVAKLNHDSIFAFANKKQFSNFLDLYIPFNLIRFTKSSNHKSSFSLQGVYDWNVYPTYDQYLEIMQKFAKDYPSICNIDTIGKTIKNRLLLSVKISDNVSTREAEPEFFYSAAIHGNEPMPYVMMLRLIDYILTNYGKIEKITQLVDNLEIYINPLANPDGAYWGGNNSIYDGIRYNANHVDLNRNFPDPVEGDHPDFEDWQPENIAMMNFMKKHNFNLSANFHTGTVVLNYPWDTWNKRHADDSWFQYICKQYADTVIKNNPTKYMKSLTESGITNGYDWYRVAGGRQDYMTYFLHGREVTIELDTLFFTPEDHLNNMWNSNYKSYLNFIEQSLYGLQGFVTDSLSMIPILAKIEIKKFDKDNSFIYSGAENGRYSRLINEGEYNVSFSAEGYKDTVINNIKIKNQHVSSLNVKLMPIKTGVFNLTVSDKNNLNPINPDVYVLIDNKQYKLVNTSKISGVFEVILKEGIYDFKITASNYYEEKLNQISIKTIENYKKVVNLLPVTVSIKIVNKIGNLIYCYPNPSKKEINFSRLPSNFDNINLKIFDLFGRLKLERQLDQSFTNTNSLNIEILEPGNYFFKIFTNREVFNGRFIKN